MRLGSQGGSQTVSTSHDVTPGTVITALCTCSGNYVLGRCNGFTLDLSVAD